MHERLTDEDAVEELRAALDMVRNHEPIAISPVSAVCGIGVGRARRLLGTMQDVEAVRRGRSTLYALKALPPTIKKQG